MWVNGKSKICRVSQQVGNPGSVECTERVQRPSAGRILSFFGDLSLLLLKTFNWLNETYLHYGNNLLCSKSTDLNVNPIWRISPQQQTDDVWPNIWVLYPSQKAAMATHSSTLAWKIPWMEEPGRLQAMGLLRVGHNWVTSLSRIGEGSGNPLQCSCLEKPRDRGAWWAAVYGVAQSRTRLKRLSSSSKHAHNQC